MTYMYTQDLIRQIGRYARMITRCVPAVYLLALRRLGIWQIHSGISRTKVAKPAKAGTAKPRLRFHNTLGEFKALTVSRWSGCEIDNYTAAFLKLWYTYH